MNKNKKVLIAYIFNILMLVAAISGLITMITLSFAGTKGLPAKENFKLALFITSFVCLLPVGASVLGIYALHHYKYKTATYSLICILVLIFGSIVAGILMLIMEDEDLAAKETSKVSTPTNKSKK